MTTLDIIIFYLGLYWSFNIGRFFAYSQIKLWQFLLLCFLVKMVGMAYVS